MRLIVRLGGVMALVVSLTAGCSPKAIPGAAGTTSSVVSTPTPTLTPTPASTSSSIAPPDVVFDGPTETLADPTSITTRVQTSTIPGPQCRFPTTPVGPEGEVTYVTAEHLWSIGANTPIPSNVAASVVATCLQPVSSFAQVNSISWSPNSTTALIGDRVVRNAGVTLSGFLPTNTDVNWSGPNGKSLLATTAKGELVKRNAKTGKRTDVSFLAKHEVSAYHPAGTAIASIGVSADPENDGTDTGIFLATNLGQEPRLLIRDETAAKLSDLSFSATGDSLYFLAQHSEHTHIHAYNLEQADLIVAYESSGKQSDLVVSAVDKNMAVRSGDCGTEPTDVLVETSGVPTANYVSLRVKIPALGNGSLSPIGWLPKGKLMVMSRPAGCSGPGDLLVVNLNTDVVEMTIPNVASAAPRVRHMTPNQLKIPFEIEVEA
jgi:hypothetical protein